MNKKPARTRKLAWEILGLIGISALFAAFLFLVLSGIGSAVAETYCFQQDLSLSEFDWLELDRWIFSLSAILSASGFSLLFLALMGDRIAYIRAITKGILNMGQDSEPLPLEGRNELTQLADTINRISAAQQQLRQKEQTLSLEKEQFLRALSHDIRTPLTSILAYSEYLEGNAGLSPGEQAQHLQTIRKKAEQIRDLTGLLLDAGSSCPEAFENAHLLMEQLAAEFEETLEDRFSVATDLSGLPAFAGSFDVRELRRIFDNLSSNVQKYADPSAPVQLRIRIENGALCVFQSNRIAPDPAPRDSYRLGIHSIRRIAQNYGGTVEIRQEDGQYSICILFLDFL